LRLEPLRDLLRCLPCLKRTHAHTVKPNLIDSGRGEVHRIAGPGELVRQGAGFFQIPDGSDLHGIAGRASAFGIGDCAAAAEFSDPALAGAHRRARRCSDLRVRYSRVRHSSGRLGLRLDRTGWWTRQRCVGPAREPAPAGVQVADAVSKLVPGGVVTMIRLSVLGPAWILAKETVTVNRVSCAYSGEVLSTRPTAIPARRTILHTLLHTTKIDAR
jgi:hypothetical protein